MLDCKVKAEGSSALVPPQRSEVGWKTKLAKCIDLRAGRMAVRGLQVQDLRKRFLGKDERERWEHMQLAPPLWLAVLPYTKARLTPRNMFVWSQFDPRGAQCLAITSPNRKSIWWNLISSERNWAAFSKNENKQYAFCHSLSSFSRLSSNAAQCISTTHYLSTFTFVLLHKM